VTQVLFQIIKKIVVVSNSWIKLC